MTNAEAMSVPSGSESGEGSENVVAFFNARRLPATVEVVQGFEGWTKSESLAPGCRLQFLYVIARPAVNFKDDLGHEFLEEATFSKFKFRLLSEDESFDDKLFLRVSDVMRLAKRPRFVRVRQGYVYGSAGTEEEAIDSGQVLETSGRILGEGADRRALWYAVPQDDDMTTFGGKASPNRVPMEIPLYVEGQFTTLTDDGTYSLEQLLQKVSKGKLSFPFRVSVARPEHDHTPVRKYTVTSSCDQQWLVATDGEKLLRVPADLPVTIAESDTTPEEMSSSLYLLSERVDHSNIRSIGPPRPGSLSAIIDAGLDKPVLPARSPKVRHRAPTAPPAVIGKLTLGGAGGRREDSEYDYVDMMKPRFPPGFSSDNDLVFPPPPPPVAGPEDYFEINNDMPPAPGPGDDYEPVDDWTDRETAQSAYQSAQNVSKRLPTPGSASSPRASRSARLPVAAKPKMPVPERKPSKSRILPTGQIPKAQPYAQTHILPPPPKPHTPPTSPTSPPPSPGPKPQTPPVSRKPAASSPASPRTSYVPVSWPESENAESEQIKRLTAENKELRAQCFQLQKEKEALENELREARAVQALTGKKLLDMSVEQVVRLLKESGLGKYTDAIEAEGVDGSLFAALDEQMLAVDFGISNRFHRMKILQLREKHA